MDEKSKKQINSEYSALLKKYGSDPKALKYVRRIQQEKRYTMMADIGTIDRQGSVLDVGCGLGHFCNFLRKYGWEGKYTGIDINPDMIKACKKKFMATPENTFICKDILLKNFDKKYDYVFCGATLEIRPQFTNPIRYVVKMVEKMFSLTNKVLSFEVYTDKVDFMRDDSTYISPAYLLDFCYSLTSRLVFRNDQRPYEAMIYLYKETEKDEINVYKNWDFPILNIR